ncbi:polyphosphate polymerase domain-containing protein [Carboxylicivirga linearis]|uniref:Polyphosphate polymerase domain-containing protein n=1 Tax=Carboxylicivirga linearis TaxID=1628157 RepID=A0ABS5K044_9BACT|nr:polyphosphate polymerase domain-containing protein [Carboxylicivirga linearis]MBS2100510.1 polyphosphate polymerase domain-containing protein [Carboxylicivirga linearis]
MNVLREIVSFYDSIGMEDMGQVKLMNRIDTKFLLSPKVLISCLSEHIEDYKVVEIKGRRILSYHTNYYDTNDLRMYYEHHNGKNRRYKVRYRKYAESGDEFLEIKMKHKGRTHKKRVAVNGFEESIKGDEKQFVDVNSPYHANDLISVLSTDFERITLVSKTTCERITIDLNIQFSDKQSTKDLDNCVIVEVKRNREDVYSSFARTIKKHGFLPLSISKYCLGTIALNNDVKYNRFKPKLRTVSGLMNKEDNAFAAVV